MKTMHKTAGLLQQAGRNGDTILAHINPAEAGMLKAAGGSGTINPETGLLEFGFWKSIRNVFQTVAVVVGNYFLPGSSTVTSKLVSKGAQKNLDSTLGKIATMASGVAGSAAGNLSNYGKLLNSVGLNSITEGIDNVSTYMSKTLNALSVDSTTAAAGNVSGEAVGSAAGNVSGEAVGSAAGNVAGGVTDATVAQSAATNADIGTQATPYDFIQDPASAMLPAGSVGPSVQNANIIRGSTQPFQGMNSAGSGGITPSPGILQKAMTWVGNNPVPALMVGQTVASGIGGMGTAEANREAAELNRQTQLQMPGIQKQAGMVQGGMTPLPFQAADPSQVLTRDGRYMYGPQAGQYAPGRRPGIVNAAAR